MNFAVSLVLLEAIRKGRVSFAIKIVSGKYGNVIDASPNL
jgi:hypothetical protein